MLVFQAMAQAQSCSLYPIAFPASAVANASVNSVLPDIFQGQQPGNYGWLTWAGSPSVPTLVASLTAPGNSASYVNPDHTADHQVSVGDWVQGKPGVSNSKNVRDALDALKHIDITVPVWDETRGQGEGAAYRVGAFVRIRILDYQLPGQNRITARFLGYATCNDANLPPVVNAGADQTITLPAGASLNGSVNDDGLPAGGTLTVSWSLVSGPGTVSFADPGAATTTATFSTHGTYLLQLTASDSQLSTSDELMITVNRENLPPVADSQSVTNLEDTTFDILLTGSDPDNGPSPLSFSIVSGPGHGPFHGELTGIPPNMRYTPSADRSGSDSFTFKVNDGLLDSANAVVTITILPVNDAPVADSQSHTNMEDTTLPITLSGADVEGSAVTFVLLTVPTNGTLNAATGPLASTELIYTPAANYHGPDSFTYKVNDGLLDSAVATVSITVVSINDMPLVDAGADQLLTLPTNSVTLAGTVTDDLFDGSTLFVEWSVVSGPGTVTFADAATNHTTATFSASGTYVLRLTADDDFFIASDDAVIVVNTPPVVSAGTNQAITLPATATLLGAVSDDGLPANGTLTVAWSKVSGPGSVIFSNPTATNTTVSFGENGLYVLRLTATDSIATATNDITVIANRAPIVDAGSDQSVPNLSVTLTGTVADDGLPPGAAAAPLWTKVSGPGEVTFEDETSPATSAIFSLPGVYVLRLTASDSLATTSDEVTITATEPNEPPFVYAGPNQLVILPATVFLAQAMVTDDGAPAGGTLTVQWSKLMGPGDVTFANATHTNTTVSFSGPGNYILRLTAGDGALSSHADATFVVKHPSMNAAPVVNAGADQTVGLTNQLALNAFAEDDGLPLGNSLTVQWSKVSGPGTVTFANAASVSTLATFDQLGTYVLRLSATDSVLGAIDEVSVTVYPDNHPPRVDAGADQSITIPDPAVLAAGTNGSWSLSTSLFTMDRWDPTISQPGFSGIPPNVSAITPGLSRYSLAAQGTNLYAAGAFTHAGGEYVYELGRWDGSSWSALFDPNPYWEIPGPIGLVVYDGINSSVHRVVTLGNEVFVRGVRLKDFDNHGIFLDSGARWSGTNWNAWNPYFLNSGGGVDSIVASSNAVYYGGFFDFQPTNAVNDGRAPFFTHSGLPVSHGVAKWTGTNWEALGDGITGQVGAMAIGKHGELYAAGAFMNNVSDGVAHNIAKWDGTNWTRLGAGLQGCTRFACYTLIIALAVDEDGAVYATGDFTTAGGLPANGIAKWDGTNWSTLGSGPDNGFNPGGGAQTLAVHRRNLYVGGAFASVGGLAVNNLAKWNGRFWLPLGQGPTNGVLGTVTAFAPVTNGIYVGGDFNLYDGSASDLALWEFAPLPSRALALEGRVTDDGRPPGATLTLQWTKASGPGDVIFADPNAAATTAEFTQLGTYVLRLTASDSDLTAFDELTVIVQGNQPPVVHAGADVVTALGQAAALTGSVTDDGALPGVPVAALWTVVSGPGTVTFGDPRDPQTSARCSAGGTYVLRLTANDSQFSASDDATIVVNSANLPPDVFGFSFGPAFLPEPAFLAGFVFDDGLPSGTLVTSWSKLSGPGQAMFANAADPNTTVSFTAAGFYLLRITATDGELTAVFDSPVEVSDPFGIGPLPGPGQAAPIVQAGPDAAGVTYGTVSLAGHVTDDGLPAGSLTVTWMLISGPAQVYFANANQPATTASFYAPGTYVLRLLATDGQLSGSDDLNILIANPPNEPPLVFAGFHLEIVRPAPALLLGTVLDDGLPAGYPLTIAWSKSSGPGTVTFAPNATALDAQATFSAPGEYILRLTADDSVLTNADEIVVTVIEGTNAPPFVYAGPDQTIALPAVALLTTEATDDGLPAGLLGVSWSQVSGPATAAFSTLNGQYRASFSETGTYVLRLTATDYELSASDDVQITVLPQTDVPTVAILSPHDAGIITAPTVITGLVASPILQSWSLLYRLKPAESEESPNPQWLTLASSTTEVNNGPLALLDPTLLLNGIYELQLTATDTIGRTATTNSTLIVDRNMKVGHFTLSFNDLTIPVAGIPIQVIRTYDSRDKRVGDFGVGWTLDLKNIRLQKNRNLGANWNQVFTPGGLGSYCLDPRRPRTVTITFPDGSTHKFQVTTSPECQPFAPIPVATVLYSPLANTRGSLVAEGLDADVVTTQGNIGGTDLFTETFDTYNPSLYRYTSDEGDTYIVHERDGLRRLTDRNGNTLTVSTNGIVYSVTPEGPPLLSVLFQRDNLGRITNILDAAGHALAYHYDTNGNLVSFVDRVNLTNTFSYNPRHELLTLTDARGIPAARNEYDASGRLIAQVDAAGNTNTFTHDLNARAEIIRDRLGRVTVHEYDDNGNVTRTIDALGHVTRMAYDASDNLLEQVDALGNTNRFTYDPRDNKLSETDALGFTTRFSYDTFSRPTSITDKRGNTTTNIFDARGNLLTSRDALNHTTTLSYDAAGNPLVTTDALGHRTESAYDSLGRLTNSAIRDAQLGVLNETSYSFDTNGNQTNMTTRRIVNGVPETLVTRMVYDSENRLVLTIHPDGSTNATIFNAIDKPAVEIDPLGRQTQHFYDDRGHRIRTVYADGTSEQWSYDEEGRMVSMTDKAQRITTYLRDALGRRFGMIHPDGAATTNYFDALGRVIAATDEHGHPTWFGYDARGMRTSITNAILEITRFGYDENGNQIEMVDALGRTNRFELDDLNRRIAMVYPDGTRSLTAYDALGRRVAQTDQSTNTTAFAYDSRGLLTAVTNALGHVTRYEYDEQSRQVTQIDALSRATRYEYDRLGRRTKRILPLNQVENCAYNAAGNLTAKTDFNGRTTTYTYDSLNRLTARIPDPAFAAPSVTFTYNELGLRTNMTDASGVTAYRYDNRNRLAEKATPQGTLRYGYDAHGSVSNISSTTPDGVRLSYGYDTLNRLAFAHDPHSGFTGYAYDAVGNLRNCTLPNGLNSFHQYDVLNRLTNLSVSRLVGTIANYAYTWDPLESTCRHASLSIL